jgi:dsDNA-specific endonuclease/ATPase MutS2
MKTTIQLIQEFENYVSHQKRIAQNQIKELDDLSDSDGDTIFGIETKVRILEDAVTKLKELNARAS